MGASNRQKLDDRSFTRWLECGEARPVLPRVWVYPGASGKSPEQAPRSARRDKSASTTESGSSRGRQRQAELRNELMKCDTKCVVSGCKVSLGKSFDQAQAAHILPGRLLDLKSGEKLHDDILRAASICRLDICALRNAMMLCTAHHTTFDRYHWTVNPASGEIRVGTLADDKTLTRSVLDFSHRLTGLRPTEAVWTSYNEYVFSDNGARLAAALRKKKGKSGAVDRIGGGGDAE